MKNTILTLILITVVSAVKAEALSVYSWKSDNGTVTQTGGTVTQYGSRVNRINMECSGYHVIMLTGKAENINDGTPTMAATYMEINLADGQTFHAGDEISITAMRNTTNTTADASLYMLFGNGTTITDDSQWNNLGLLTETSMGGGVANSKAGYVPSVDGSTTEQLTYISLEPNTNVFTVPDEAEGATTLRLTRDKSECYLYIVSINVSRVPTAIENVVENASCGKPFKYLSKDGKGIVIGNYKADGKKIR
ncbi:MAG: hypothetical protein IKQ68_01305 [Prevotella sp.]|nr:hypothetical protein [Prevotella sp.]